MLESLSEASQSLVFFEQAKTGHGPKLLGVFEGGRLEQYIESSTLEDKYLLDPTIRKEFAQQIARFHTLQLPFTKNANLVGDNFAKHFEKKFDKKKFLSDECLQSSGVDYSLMADLDFSSEWRWLRETLGKIKCRKVFCIRDLNRLNCLVRETPNEHNERIVLIDFELSAYAPRGLDLGSHFNMWTVDGSQPDFLSTVDYPSEEIQLEVGTYFNCTAIQILMYHLQSMLGITWKRREDSITLSSTQSWTARSTFSRRPSFAPS